MTEKEGVLTKCHRVIVAHLCLPFIHSFFSSLVSNSSERLYLDVPCINHNKLYGGKKKENNNNNNNDDNEEMRKPVTMFIESPIHMAWSMLLDAKMGLGEAYMNGDWKATPTPTHLLNLMIRAKKESSQVAKKPATLTGDLKKKAMEIFIRFVRTLAAIVNYAQHRWRDNTLSQSARNIEDHYDLGNEMFQLFLDPSMTYSCAVYQDPAKPELDTLEEAQIRKMDNLIEMLQLNEKDHVLEIGCGWGACAIRAVKQTGCKWTGLTISHEQLALGKEKVAKEGLQDKIDLRYQDYRLAEGKYTHVISVEMIEAVGQAFLPQYFQVISDRLEPGGRAVLQAITCPDSYYERYCQSSDFIKKHIFPGGHMPSIGAICNSLPADLNMGEKRHIGRHYAPTLDSWFNAWMSKEKELRELGVSARFHRKWQFYFCLCSSLFSNDHIDTIQFVLQKDS